MLLRRFASRAKPLPLGKIMTDPNFPENRWWTEQNYVPTHTARFGLTLEFVKQYYREGHSVGSIGASYFDRTASAFFGARNFWRVVPNPEFIANSGESGDEAIQTVYYDLTKESGPAPRQFDLLLMLEVLEHILERDDVVLKRVKSLILPGGYFCLSVPNLVRHVNRLKVLIGVNPLQTKEMIVTKGMGGFGHLREYSIAEVLRLLKPEYSVVKLVGINPYGTVRQRRVLDLLPKSLASTILVISKPRM